jgi:hypothetical protein
MNLNGLLACIRNRNRGGRGGNGWAPRKLRMERTHRTRYSIHQSTILTALQYYGRPRTMNPESHSLYALGRRMDRRYTSELPVFQRNGLHLIPRHISMPLSASPSLLLPNLTWLLASLISSVCWTSVCTIHRLLVYS